MTVTICTGGPKTWHRSIRLCPTEGKRRRFIGFSQEWYSTVWTCCGCGDSWSEGERAPRPFAPRWRERSVAEAQQWWKEAA